MEAYEIQSIVKAIKHFTVEEVLVELGYLRPMLTMREAYRIHKKPVVDRWIKEGLIKVVKDGDNSAEKRISRMELKALSLTSNRMTYLTVKERN